MRGRVHLGDVIIGAVVLVGTLGAAPAIYDLTGRIGAEAGPLGTLLLQLIVPIILVGTVVSIGVSARREA